MSWCRLWLTAVLVFWGRRDQAGAVGSSVGWRNSLGIFQLDFQRGLDKMARDHRPRCAESTASLGTVGQMQPPWEAGEQTYLSFCWWVVMPRKSFLLCSLWLEVCHCNTWKMVSCSPCEGLPILGASLLQCSSQGPLSLELWLAQAACPLPTDPPGSSNFLCILMICCKCALFCLQTLSQL